MSFTARAVTNGQGISNSPIAILGDCKGVSESLVVSSRGAPADFFQDQELFGMKHGPHSDLNSLRLIAQRLHLVALDLLVFRMDIDGVRGHEKAVQMIYTPPPVNGKPVSPIHEVWTRINRYRVKSGRISKRKLEMTGLAREIFMGDDA